MKKLALGYLISKGIGNDSKHGLSPNRLVIDKCVTEGSELHVDYSLITTKITGTRINCEDPRDRYITKDIINKHITKVSMWDIIAWVGNTSMSNKKDTSNMRGHLFPYR